MPRPLDQIPVYLEIGQKRTFAGAIDWPGWSRSAGDESAALQALYDYGPRYARVVRAARLGFKRPVKESTFVVVERLRGNATTDFGAPGLAPSSDSRQVNSEELHRFEKLLRACWRTFDANIKAAGGKKLRLGPRGGGRQLEGIVQHVLGSDAGYMNQAGWKFKEQDTGDLDHRLKLTRQAILDALAASARGEIPPKGPRGGLRWSPRYFVRRLVWHVLDHAWEIEDRLQDE